MKLALPQPYEDLDHTADVGVRVRGATAEEALARLVLAYAALLAGGGAVAAEAEERLAIPAQGGALALVAVALLRELLYRFATERRIPASCEVVRAGPDGAEAVVAFGRHDPDLHAEGMDLKAVTYHAARFEPEAEAWVAQVVFDI